MKTLLHSIAHLIGWNRVIIVNGLNGLYSKCTCGATIVYITDKEIAERMAYLDYKRYTAKEEIK